MLSQTINNSIAALDEAKPESRVGVLKRLLDQIDNRLAQCYEQHMKVDSLVSLRAKLMDELLIGLWKHIGLGDALSLLATGGYGRGELHPCSDIDLLVLYQGRINKKQRRMIQDFLTFLWDMGLTVGHSVRTPAMCEQAARRDIGIATGLMEARLLSGNLVLHQKLMERMSPERIWPSHRFFSAKCAEQRERHRKFSDTSHNVEPHIKDGPGGLRDIQTIAWVTKRHFGVGHLRDLIKLKFLTRSEYHALRKGQELLWQIRYGLHLLTGRCEDRLLFDYQKRISSQFGYHGPGNQGVEMFMKDYHNTVLEMNRLNEMLLQHFEEDIICTRKKQQITNLNQRFRIHNNVIEVRNSRVFKRNRFALLEMFLLIQQHPQIHGVRASTIRLVRHYAEQINEDFRHDIRARSYFMEIIRQPRAVWHELRRMHRYGVLGAYLPVFSHIQGLMQFDLFHSYTVDEHSLFVIRNLRRFNLPEYREHFPLCHQVIKKIPKQEVLYVAGLFHDIAKGQGGDHSRLGAKEVMKFCIAHQFSEYDTRLTVWLVRHHLLMSIASQKIDIDDPAAISDFALKVTDQNYLNHLYLLTVADICATNAELWNSWRDSLLSELYYSTLMMMRRGKEKSRYKTIRTNEQRDTALTLIRNASEKQVEISRLWKNLHTDYFLRHTPAEIAWHTSGIIDHGKKSLPLILLRHEPHHGWSQIFVYTKDTTGLFSSTANAIEALSLNVHDARIITSKNHFALNTYVVLEDDGSSIRGARRCKEIVQYIRQKLVDTESDSTAQIFRIKHRKLESFNFPTQVHFNVDKKNSRLIMEVSTLDRVGVLSRVGHAIDHNGMQLLGAKIATYGERVEDIFYLRRRSGDLPQSDTWFAHLSAKVIAAIDG